MGRATNRTSRCPTHRRSPPKALAQPTPLRRCDGGGLRTQGRAFRPVLMCWRGRRNYDRTKGDREHTTSGAATNDQGNSLEPATGFRKEAERREQGAHGLSINGGSVIASATMV